jgi:hypothetical protein
MKNPKRLLMIGLLIAWISGFFMGGDSDAGPKVYYGDVVGMKGKVIQVKDKDGRVSVFWLGRRTKFDSRAPFSGDRVRIEYVKDRLGRNAVTRITIMSKEK